MQVSSRRLLVVLAVLFVPASCGARTALWVPPAVKEVCPREQLSEAAPEPVVGVPAQLALGTEHTCVRAGTDVWCWGNDRNGELGDGLTQPRGRPVRVKGLPPALDVAAGDGLDLCRLSFEGATHGSHTCARLLDRTVSCWGADVEGSFPNDPAPSTPVPTVVANLFDVVQFAPGYVYNAAVLGDGTVRYWVLGPTINQEPGLANVKKIGVGGSGFMCALLMDGTVSCWGAGYGGQLGDGTRVDHYTPAPVPSLHGVVDIAVGTKHSCALIGDGTVSCWGLNDFGQLGIGRAPQPLVPVAALGITSAVQIATGHDVSCAVLRDGTVRCWGENLTGALGTGVIGGSQGVASPPTPVLGLSDVVEIATSGVHTCARVADGSVWCWGLNNAGQVGDGTTVTRPAPVRVLP